MRDDNDRLADSVVAMERRERDVVERSDLDRTSLIHEQTKKEEARSQLRQKEKVM